MTDQPGYYDNPRRDLQELVPMTARHILDVGCGSGALGAELKARQPCFVAGIELDSVQADRARDVLDHVIAGDVENLDLDGELFDCIVLGDVLEHLRDPETVLRKLHRALTDGGRLVISVPNVRHWSVVRALLEGHWDYEDTGLLDREHLRMFTRASLEETLRRAGFVPQPQHEIRLGDAVPGDVVDAMAARGLDVTTLEDEGRVYQFLYTACKTGAIGEQKTRIVVVAHNLWPQTRTCLESIAACTPEPHEVVIVDNASDDETAEALDRWVTEYEGARAVHNQTNQPYAAACNIGAAFLIEPDIDFVLLLNNDTVMTPGWLGRMLAVFERHPQAAIVGPMSNYVAGGQQIPDVPYRALDEMRDFAAEWADEHAGETARVAGVIGFCFLVRRNVWDALGGFDERFVNGYEETDLCYQAIQAGHEIRIAGDAFVHHSGSQTFMAEGADPREPGSRYWQQIDENWQRFREKWDIPEGMDAHQGLGWLIRRISEPEGQPRVFWAYLYERAGFPAWEAADAAMDIAANGARNGYQRLGCPYTATDNARNQIVRLFREMSQHPDDVLVMLDVDHRHPSDIVQQLASHSPEWGVVGALAFRRGPPHDPVLYFRDARGQLQQPADELEHVVYECDLVGSGAIAIRRWVFDRLEEHGHLWPFFRCEYPINSINRPGEEIYFGQCCEAIGVKAYLDATVETPHLAVSLIDRSTWKSYARHHPEIVRELQEDEIQ